MILNSRRSVLAIYNIILSVGAIITGILMVQSDSGVFTEFPKEWTSKLPFDNWVVPGIIIIVLFGLGNLIAGVSFFHKNKSSLWITSSFMGLTLLFCLGLQFIVLKDWYMPDNQFFIMSIIQLFLSVIVFLKKQKSFILGGFKNE